MQKKYIKNIHLYSVNNKFNRNLIDSYDDNLIVTNIPNNKSLYRYIYTNDFNNEYSNAIIINSSILNQEIASFIRDFLDKINIWIFIDKEIMEYISGVKYITTNVIQNINSKILPNNIVNKNFYYNIQNISKINQIPYFLHNDSESDLEKIKNYLYPRSKLNIKLFDSKDFSHPQNLGYITEDYRYRILLESKYYMHNSSNYYLTESLICGCIPIDVSSDQTIETQLNNKSIMPKNIVYYSDFAKELFDE